MRKKKLLAVGLSALILATGCNNANTNGATQTGESSGVISGELVDLGDNEAEVAKAEKMIQNMYADGAYMMLHVSEDSADDIMFIYNQDKNCYAETPDGCPMYYDELGNLRVFTDPYKDTKDVSPLQLTEGALQLARHGVALVNVKEISLEDIYNNMIDNVQSQIDAETAETISAKEAESASETEEAEEPTKETEDTTKEIAESAESVEETASAKEVVESYLGWTKEEVIGKTYSQLEITIHGRENIYELYRLQLGDKAEEFVDELFNGDNTPDDDHLAFSIHGVDEENYMQAGVMLWVTPTENNSSVAWWFEGYIPIGGSWESLDDDWFAPNRKTEDVKKEMTALVNELGSRITEYANNTFGDGTLVETEPSTEVIEAPIAETTEAVDDESVEAAEPVAEIDSIKREGSFKVVVDDLLEEDGLIEADSSTFKVPEGYSESDRDTMIDMYSRLITWDAEQSDGTLVSPLSPDEVEFATKYIEACENEYLKDASNNGETTDEFGTIYWKDTVGVFLQAINK